jgi:hypothetical protein
MSLWRGRGRLPLQSSTRCSRRWGNENATPFRFYWEGGKNLYGVLPETAARAKFLRAAAVLMPPAAEGGKKWRN